MKMRLGKIELGIEIDYSKYQQFTRPAVLLSADPVVPDIEIRPEKTRANNR